MRLQSTLAFLAALTFLLTSCGQPSQHTRTAARASAADLLTAVRQRGELLVSTDADYAPQSFKTSDGSWHGFDVDVAREIARRLGVKAKFLDIKFDAITGGNWNGKWDVNVDSMTITRERQRVLYFTDPYYYIPASFTVYKDSRARSIDDLSGKRVGVGTATTYQAYLDGHLTLANERILQPEPQARAIPYDTDEKALRDLSLGDGVRLDGALTSLIFVQYEIKSGMPIKPLGTPVFYEDAAVAIDRNSPDDPSRFYQAVENAVKSMHADGTLSRLSRKYYGVDLTGKS